MKKSHPIRRVVLAGAATVSGIVLLLSLKPASDPASASAQGASPQQSVAGQEAPQGGSAQQSSTGAQTVTGDVAQTQYGPVQVRITVSGGKITKSEVVQIPSGGRSTEVSNASVPKLNQEAVTAGSADIDAVSGASYTSAGYKKSLQSALDKAKASGSGSSGAAGSTGSAGSGSSGSSGSASSQAPAAQAKTVTGSVAQTQYGAVQVRITVSGGKITKSEAVQAPKGGLSDQKTALAVPRLNQEAVAAGNADIDAVSGATYTSTGYKQSLQSALDKAGG
ncbi:FMN-binding protein [Streptomyces sp. NBC_01728]|uniref:FMN-binding protein n=1 Tax=unclassified Streptomyces TaxID=2593676 RepID=UPI002254A0D3|nr:MULTISPECIES: FMN-binding protein [unclassified Streptomyces]MCX4452850.1 FMN-binding protein [Streptomyces sp. NBC_01719]MCX4492210.1 FMN-binding protein [Streptomyces sp. NBC_01728]